MIVFGHAGVSLSLRFVKHVSNAKTPTRDDWMPHVVIAKLSGGLAQASMHQRHTFVRCMVGVSTYHVAAASLICCSDLLAYLSHVSEVWAGYVLVEMPVVACVTPKVRIRSVVRPPLSLE